jgi:hypothetical protein
MMLFWTDEPRSAGSHAVFDSRSIDDLLVS